jgi:predicted Zn finger-like uncharacterized protein
MKVQCPNCNATYQVDSSKIPPNGAYATCRKCRTRFQIVNPKAQNGESKQEIITCPNCGHQQPKSVECENCGIVFSKYYESEEKKVEKRSNTKPLFQKTFEVFKKDKNNSWKQSLKDKSFSPIIFVSVIVALAVSFVGYKIYLNLESKYAEKEFSTFVGTISTKMIKLAIESNTIVDEIKRAWHEAIFSDSNKRDFEVAIGEVLINRADDILSVKKLSEEISKNIKNMNPAVGKENDYKRLKELYLLFNKYADMAISPSGSLQTYSQQSSELTVEVTSAIKELEMMR